MTRWRWAIGGVALFGVVVLVGVLNSGREGGDTAELIDRFKGALEARGTPQGLTDCWAERLEAGLDDEEVEKLYDSARGINGGTAAVLANPKVEKEAARSGILCALQLEGSGQYNREELIEDLHSMAGGGLGESS